MAVIVPKAAYIVGGDKKKKKKSDPAVFCIRIVQQSFGVAASLGGVYLVRANRPECLWKSVLCSRGGGSTSKLSA